MCPSLIYTKKVFKKFLKKPYCSAFKVFLPLCKEKNTLTDRVETLNLRPIYSV